MKKGFTLIELIVVIIIVGILATLGFSQYLKMVEKGRTAEAKAILGALRSAEQAYYLERGTYTATVAQLPVDAPIACAATHYFSYSATAANGNVTAARCTGNGKTPDAVTGYSITLNNAGAWSGTVAGYY